MGEEEYESHSFFIYMWFIIYSRERERDTGDFIDTYLDYQIDHHIGNHLLEKRYHRFFFKLTIAHAILSYYKGNISL